MLVRHDGLFDVFFSSDDNGWVVGTHGLIVHTADGGKSWQKQPSGTYSALGGISFSDDKNGFAVGQNGTILATTDGGQNWSRQASGVKAGLLAVQAFGPREAVAVGAFGEYVSTSDGGQTWVSRHLPWDKLLPELTNSFGYVEPSLNGLFFENRQRGWIVGEFGLVIRTIDGGENWTVQRQGESMPQLYAIKRSHEGTMWATGQHGTLLRSSDGETAWQPVSLGVTDDLYALSWKGKHGMIVGNNGLAFASEDGGTTWSRVANFPSDVWLSGVATVGDTPVAVGQAGSIFYFPSGKSPCQALSPACGAPGL